MQLGPLLSLKQRQHDRGRHERDAAPDAVWTKRPSQAGTNTPCLVVEAFAAADRVQRALVDDGGDAAIRKDGRQIAGVGDRKAQPWRLVTCSRRVDCSAAQVDSQHIGPAIGVQLSRQAGRAAAELEHGRGARKVRQVLMEGAAENALIGQQPLLLAIGMVGVPVDGRKVAEDHEAAREGKAGPGLQWPCEHICVCRDSPGAPRPVGAHKAGREHDAL